MTRVALSIAADHPAFAGHFPSRPIVPGVVLLDASLRAIAGTLDPAQHGWSIASAKFLSFVLPGEIVRLEYERPSPAGPFRLRVLVGDPDERVAVVCSATPVTPC